MKFSKLSWLISSLPKPMLISGKYASLKYYSKNVGSKITKFAVADYSLTITVSMDMIFELNLKSQIQKTH